MFSSMKRSLIVALVLLMAVACGSARPSLQERIDAAVDSTLASYTLEEKVFNPGFIYP